MNQGLGCSAGLRQGASEAGRMRSEGRQVPLRPRRPAARALCRSWTCYQIRACIIAVLPAGQLNASKAGEMLLPGACFKGHAKRGARSNAMCKAQFSDACMAAGASVHQTCMTGKACTLTREVRCMLQTQHGQAHVQERAVRCRPRCPTCLSTTHNSLCTGDAHFEPHVDMCRGGGTAHLQEGAARHPARAPGLP